MAVSPRYITELELFVVHNVQPTGVELGNGAYGAVEEVRIPGAICAAKKMHELLLRSASPQEEREMGNTFLRECTLLSRLRHPHIVQFLGVCYLPGSRLPLLVMERLLMSLDDLLENKQISIPFDPKLSFLKDVAKGLLFLHSQMPPVIHRDLTARNVLLNTSMVAKIADLGVARIVNIQPGRVAATMTRNPGNVVYMPPEAAEDVAKYSTALDMFSYGNLAIFTLSRQFPDLKAATYSHSRSRKLIARSEVERREDVFLNLYQELGEDHELVRLSKLCLSNYPEERPSAYQVIEHLARVNPTGRDWEKTKLQLLQELSIAGNELVLKQRDIDDLNNKVDVQDKELDQVQRENQSLRQEKTSMREQIELLQKQIEDKDNENKALEQRNRILQQQVRSQELQLQRAKEYQEEIDLASLPEHLKSASSSEVLRKCLSFLYQHLDPVKVIPIMTEASLLNAYEAQELSSYQHDSAKSIALVDKMFCVTTDTKISLIKVLKAIPGQEYIGTKLAQELKEIVIEKKRRTLSSGDLAELFLQLLKDVMAAFDSYPNGVDQLKRALASLVIPLGDGKEAALVPPTVYQDAQTTRELFKCMSPYFGPLSSDVLQFIIHRSGCDEAAKLVDDFVLTRANNRHLVLYSKRKTKTLLGGSPTLKAFHNTPVGKLQSAKFHAQPRLPEHQSVTVDKDVTRVSVQVNRSVMCLSDYDSILTALSGFFIVPRAALTFVGCAESPLFLSWVVSSPVCNNIKSTLGGVSGEMMVAQERIISLAIGQDISYKCLTIEESELLEASRNGGVEKVQSLLKLKDINVNCTDYHGATALYCASQEGHDKIVQLLIHAGANIDLQHKRHGDTALKRASTTGDSCQKVVELLLAAGAKVDVQAKGGSTALYLACQGGHEKIVQLLIQAGSNVNHQNNSGATPLMIASLNGHEKVVMLLCKAGAKIDIQNKWSETAAYYARAEGHVRISQLLLHYTKLGAQGRGVEVEFM